MANIYKCWCLHALFFVYISADVVSSSPTGISWSCSLFVKPRQLDCVAQYQH